MVLNFSLGLYVHKNAHLLQALLINESNFLKDLKTFLSSFKKLIVKNFLLQYLAIYHDVMLAVEEEELVWKEDTEKSFKSSNNHLLFLFYEKMLLRFVLYLLYHKFCLNNSWLHVILKTTSQKEKFYILVSDYSIIILFVISIWFFKCFLIHM